MFENLIVYLCIFVNGLNIVDESGKVGFAHWTRGGHLRPLDYALETETICSKGQRNNSTAHLSVLFIERGYGSKDQ